MQNVVAISELLKPCDARLMRRYSVSSRINSVVNDDEECSAPAELAEMSPKYFCLPAHGVVLARCFKIPRVPNPVPFYLQGECNGRPECGT
jgi:hypothetical protein